MANRSPILLITRPAGAAETFARQVHEALGRKVETVISPLIGIEYCEPSLPLPDHDGVILTSANAVKAVSRLGIPKETQAWCVGSRTAQAARDEGLDARDAGGDADALVRMILQDRPAGKLLHLRGEISRGDVADRLSSEGIPCEDVVVYRQNAQALGSRAREALAGHRPVVIPLFSPRSAAIFVENGPFKAPIHVICMSAAVAAKLERVDVIRLETAKSPDAASMVHQTSKVLRLLSTGAA